jgi:hypothetical protein
MIQREIERTGVATVSISLIREFTERIKPPRALWVPFPFGRPFGEPDNTGIQRKVILAALQLLERRDGPMLLEEFPLAPEEQYLDARWQTVGRHCTPEGCSLEDEGTPKEVAAYSGEIEMVKAEIEALRAFYQRYRVTRGGRTQLGGSGLAADEMALGAEVVHRFVRDDDLGALPGLRRPGASARYFVRLVIDDLKAFYTEAALAKSSDAGKSNAAQLNDWFWLETCAGRMVIAARDRLVVTTDPAEDPNWIMARGIVPRGYGAAKYGLGHFTG